jgi:hypothetical protein
LPKHNQDVWINFGRKSKYPGLGDNRHAFGKKYRSGFHGRQSLCRRASSEIGMSLALDYPGLLENIKGVLNALDDKKNRDS